MGSSTIPVRNGQDTCPLTSRRGKQLRASCRIIIIVRFFIFFISNYHHLIIIIFIFFFSSASHCCVAVELLSGRGSFIHGPTKLPLAWIAAQ